MTASFTVVQTGPACTGSGSVAVTCAATTAGTNLLVTLVTPSLTPFTAPANWRPAKTVPAGTAGHVEQWYLEGPDNPGGLTSFSFGGASGANCRGSVTEVSLTAGYKLVIEGTGQAATQTGGTTMPLTSAAGNIAGCLGFASFADFFSASTSGTWTVPSGWTHAGTVASGAGDLWWSGYALSLSAGNQSLTSGLTATGGTWCAALTTFRATRLDHMALDGAGMASCAAVSPDGQVLMAGGDTGGMWRSVDGGSHWRASQAGAYGAKWSSVASLQFSLLETATVYAAVGSQGSGGGLLASADGGTTWALRSAGVQFAGGDTGSPPPRPAGEDQHTDRSAGTRLLAQDVVNNLPDGHIYAAAFQGLYRSDDLGGTWTDISPGTSTQRPSVYPRAVVCNPGNPKEVWVAAWAVGSGTAAIGGIWHTANATVATPTWTQLTGYTGTVADLVIVGGWLYAACNTGGVYRCQIGTTSLVSLNGSGVLAPGGLPVNGTAKANGIDGYVDSGGNHQVIVAIGDSIQAGTGNWQNLVQITVQPSATGVFGATVQYGGGTSADYTSFNSTVWPSDPTKQAAAMKLFFNGTGPANMSDGSGTVATFPKTFSSNATYALNNNFKVLIAAYRPWINQTLTTWDSRAGSADGTDATSATHGGTGKDWAALSASLSALDALCSAKGVTFYAIFHHEIEHMHAPSSGGGIGLTPVQYWSMLSWYGNALFGDPATTGGAGLPKSRLWHNTSATYSGQMDNFFPANQQNASPAGPRAALVGAGTCDNYSRSWPEGWRLTSAPAGGNYSTSIVDHCLNAKIPFMGCCEIGIGDNNIPAPADIRSFLDEINTVAQTYPVVYLWFGESEKSPFGLIPGYASGVTLPLSEFDQSANPPLPPNSPNAANPGPDCTPKLRAIAATLATGQVWADLTNQAAGTVNVTTLPPDGRGWWQAGATGSSWLGGSGFTNGHVVIDPTDPTRIYCTGAGGFYRSTDSGANWQLAVNGMAMTAWNAFAIDPANSSHIVLCGQAFTSTDTTDITGYNAAAVTESNPGPANSGSHAAAFDPTDSLTFLGINGPFGSSAGGGVFARLPGSGNGPWTDTGFAAQAAGAACIGLLAGRDASGHRFILAIGQGKGLYRAVSTNTTAGTVPAATDWTWTAPAGAAASIGTSGTVGQVCPFAYKTTGPNIYLLDRKSGIYRSTDYGVTWTLIWAQTSTVATVPSGATGWLALNLNVTGELWISTGDTPNGLYKMTAANAGTVGSPGGPTVTAISTGVPAPGGIAFYGGKIYAVWLASSTHTSAQIMTSADGGTTWADAGLPEIAGYVNSPGQFTITPSGQAVLATGSNTAIVGILPGVTPGTLTVTTTSLPNGQNGIAYNGNLAATGGTPAYTWAVHTGGSSLTTLGLTLNSDGSITGTPSATGTATFTAQVTDSATPTPATALSGSLTITVTAPVLNITTTSLPVAPEGVAYSQTLAATGGTPSYTWTKASGTLPTGLSLSAGGVISGTPTAAGTFTFTAKVTDSATPTPATDTQVLAITVPSPVLTITTTSLPAAVAGAPYSQTLAATGGVGSYTWAVISSGVVAGGAGTTGLPDGFTLSAGGVLSGTGTAPSATAITFQVSDTGGNTASQLLTLVVQPPATSGAAAEVLTLSGGQWLLPQPESLTGSAWQPDGVWVVSGGTWA